MTREEFKATFILQNTCNFTFDLLLSYAEAAATAIYGARI